MKKKIYISTHTMNVGGVERSLLGLLEHFDYEKYDVDLFVHNHSGVLFSRIPQNVNILPEIKEYALLTEPISASVRAGVWPVIKAKLYSKLKMFVQSERNSIREDKVDSKAHLYLIKAAAQALPAISSKEYDCCFSFLHPHHIDLAKINAKQYFGWVHSDYTKLEIDVEEERKMWSEYDRIVHVSDSAMNSFLHIFPEFIDRSVVVENILSVDEIRKQAKECLDDSEMPREDGFFCLLSIGRFSYAKNFDSIPEIAMRLMEKGLKFRWYLIGYGADEELIRSKIVAYNMQDFVIMLGKKNNPYPYIANCDLYIQPSRFEGKAVTVREAQILGKPVIITAFPTSESQLINSFDGIIVPKDTQGCAEGIYDFIQNKTLLSEIKHNLVGGEYGNVSELKKIYNLIEKRSWR